LSKLYQYLKNFKSVLFFKDELLKENKEIGDRLQSYEKKMVDIISENQTLAKENKKLSLEKEHIQALNLKLQREMFEKDNILNVSLSPTKKNSSEINESFFNVSYILSISFLIY
jgi:regulator of replication initiation timing